MGKEEESKGMRRKRKEGGREGEKRGEDRKESDYKSLWSKQVIVQLATDDKPQSTGKPYFHNRNIHCYYNDLNSNGYVYNQTSSLHLIQLTTQLILSQHSG